MNGPWEENVRRNNVALETQRKPEIRVRSRARTRLAGRHFEKVDSVV